MPDGRLFIVSTPIGHLGDLSRRAIDTLAQVDRVACEDTRRTGRLLAGLGIERRLISLHEHNERRRLPGLLADLDAGLDIALVSDAGTPLVSDPGFLLVRAAVERGIAVQAVPGPSAALAALAVSGLPPHPFTFLGFPPPKRGKRRTFFERHSRLEHTLVLFESPHRLLSSLADLEEVMGDRPAVLGRELTKVHEEVLRDRLSALRTAMAERDVIKGEIVLVLGGAGSAEPRPGPGDREPGDRDPGDRDPGDHPAGVGGPAG